VKERFFTPVQTGPGAHPAFYTMVTRSFQGVKRQGRDVDYLHLAPRLKKEYSYNFTPLPGFVTCSRAAIYLYQFLPFISGDCQLIEGTEKTTNILFSTTSILAEILTQHFPKTFQKTHHFSQLSRSLYSKCSFTRLYGIYKALILHSPAFIKLTVQSVNF